MSKNKYNFLVSYFFKNHNGESGFGNRSFSSSKKLFYLFGNDNYVKKAILKDHTEHKEISFIAVSEIGYREEDKDV